MTLCRGVREQPTVTTQCRKVREELTARRYTPVTTLCRQVGKEPAVKEHDAADEVEAEEHGQREKQVNGHLFGAHRAVHGLDRRPREVKGAPDICLCDTVWSVGGPWGDPASGGLYVDGPTC